jgi:hypothetical protein
VNDIYYESMPEGITKKIERSLEAKLASSSALFKYDVSKLEVYGISTTNWFGNIIANGIINENGIKDLKITSLESITANVPVFYEDNIVASFVGIYFDDQNIVFPDFEFAMSTINLSICSSCLKHNNDCICRQMNDRFDNKVREIMNIVNLDNFNEVNVHDPESLLYRKKKIEIVEQPKKPEVDLIKFQPILKGISTTLRYKMKDIEDTALKILTSNPDMPDNQLATEIIRKMRG